MPVTANEKPRLSDLLKVTENQLWDAGYMIDYVTANEASETEYQIGNLLGQVTGGDYKISLDAAIDGSEVIKYVVLENKTLAAATDTQVKVLVRGGAIVSDKAIILGDHTLAAATTALEAMNPPVLVAEQL